MTAAPIDRNESEMVGSPPTSEPLQRDGRLNRLNRESTFITRVVLKSYRSIEACDVSLQPLSILVGPNGAGKSNFVDALRFVADALRSSLDQAIRERGGIDAVRQRSTRRPRHFGIRLEFRLQPGTSGHYAFEIGAVARGGYRVQREACVIRAPESRGGSARFEVLNGNVVTMESRRTQRIPLERDGEGVSVSPYVPPATADRLYLVTAAGLPEFRPVYDALTRMGFYNLVPNRIRDLQPPDPGDLLANDGSNIAAVLGELETRNLATKTRIEEYLGKIVPGIVGISRLELGPRETLEFRQRSNGAKSSWTFPAANMSDGTLRALGVLVALFQTTGRGRPRMRMVAIEEPEIALHPAAAGVLLGSLRDASRQTQVLVTSHSPDLIDDDEIPPKAILAVMLENGVTRIGPIDEVSRSVLIDHLFTGGELMRLNQLSPESGTAENAVHSAARLFDERLGE